MVDITIENLNKSLGTRREAYNFASTVYYLPSFDCRCCTTPYLNAIVNENCPYFKIEKTKVHPQHISYRKYDSQFLLVHLEDYLFSHNLKCTGFEALEPPNLQWLYDVILSLDPSDPLSLLAGAPQTISQQATIKIDPKYCYSF